MVSYKREIGRIERRHNLLLKNHESAPNQSIVDPRSASLWLPPVQMHTDGGLGAYLRKVWVIARKDLRAELRAKEVVGTMLAFSVLSVVVFGLAFDGRVPRPELIVPGVLWVVVLFTGLLGLNRSFGAEADRSSLPALLLAPVDRSAIYFGKLIASLVFLLLTELILLPTILILFDTNLLRVWILVGLFLGTVGYVSVGTLFAAMATSSRARESLLPIMLLPLMVPIFVAGLGLTSSVLDGNTFADFQHWVLMLGVYDLIFATISFMVFDLLWEDV